MNKPTARIQDNVVIGIMRKEDMKAKSVLDAGKGEVLKEFEKICPSDRSFQRLKKEMHDIFDQMLNELQGN